MNLPWLTIISYFVILRVGLFVKFIKILFREAFLGKNSKFPMNR